MRFTIDKDNITVVDNNVEDVGGVYHDDGAYKGLYTLKDSREAKHLCDLLNLFNERIKFESFPEDFVLGESGNFIFIATDDGVELTGYFDSYERTDINKIIGLLNTLNEENKMLKKKFETFEEIWFQFEEAYYTKIYTPSEAYDEKQICEISNILFGDKIPVKR